MACLSIEKGGDFLSEEMALKYFHDLLQDQYSELVNSEIDITLEQYINNMIGYIKEHPGEIKKAVAEC